MAMDKDDFTRVTRDALVELPSRDEDDEQFALDILFDSGSEGESDGAEPRTRAPNKNRYFDGALKRIVDDYFALTPVYSEVDFEIRLRMPRSVFNRIKDKLFTRSFFQKKTDRSGTLGKSVFDLQQQRTWSVH
eukprot:IDg21639t1